MDNLQFFSNFLILYALSTRNENIRRRVWSYPRNQHYFEEMFDSPAMAHFFKEHFRLNRDTFIKVCELLEPHLGRQTTHLRRPVPLATRVAIGLRRLGTGDSFESLGLQFGVGESTCHLICSQFELALVEKMPEFIKFPNDPDSVRLAIRNFEKMYGIPQIVGCIDGCHIEINGQGENKECYFCRKQFYSVVLQGIVDSSLKFIDISCGYPGSMHDSRIFSISPIFNAINNHEVMTYPIRKINGVSVGPLLAGDSAYPLSSYLIKPYLHRQGLTTSQRKFNKKFCATRSVVERAFGLLKNRWRLLYKLNEQQLPNVVRSINAACVLHNFCLANGDAGDEFIEAETITNANDISLDADGMEAEGIRNAVLDYMTYNNLL